MNALVKITPNIKKFNDYIFEVKKGTTPRAFYLIK